MCALVDPDYLVFFDGDGNVSRMVPYESSAAPQGEFAADAPGLGEHPLPGGPGATPTDRSGG